MAKYVDIYHNKHEAWHTLLQYCLIALVVCIPADPDIKYGKEEDVQ